MTSRYTGRVCFRCDKTITGKAEAIAPFSDSGARPDVYRHKLGDPECRPDERARPVNYRPGRA